MSRIIRRQIYSVLEELQNMNGTMMELFTNRDVNKLMHLLAECQNGAVEIGTQIETIYGDGKDCIQNLESYCEYVYLMAKSLNDENEFRKNHKLSSLQLDEMKKNMDQEVENKLELVFFPYKASEWDSLESIYWAAKEDCQCDVYCVPIPYYDLNQDRTFGKLHDESGEYPSGVEITHWQEYSFEERKPDIIFINNPYDDWNVSNSVEPRFYAENLRKYTEKLVYVPSDVLDEIKPDDRVSISAMKHLCYLPGTIHADKIIVQSENMRRIYMSEYVRAAEELGKKVDEEVLERKIIGLGVPKMDKKPKQKRDKYTLPEEWNRIIRKLDGGQKKVIFYNIGINELLLNGEKELEKIKYVLSVFRKLQKEVSLWWWSNSQAIGKLKAMRTQVWEEYIKIVEQYKNEAWGIYDNSVELDRAVIWSDAYYGDWNSIAWLYQKAGKLVMLQNMDVLEE